MFRYRFKAAHFIVHIMITLDFRLNVIRALSSDLISSDPRLLNFTDIRQPPGREHYFFLTALAMQLKNKTILEFGTHTGDSAFCLAFANRHSNNQNKIITYDIELKPRALLDPTNIDYRLENMFDPEVREKNRNFLLSSDVIFIDIDPHEGLLEYDMYIWLKKNQYKGIILFDDIHLGRGHMGSTCLHSMQEFWDKIETNDKIDLTSVGHWSGTGLVCFFPENYTFLRD
jgi:predicted O-methyltransferase YrrM